MVGFALKAAAVQPTAEPSRNHPSWPVLMADGFDQSIDEGFQKGNRK